MAKFKEVKSLLYISLNLEDFYGKDLASRYKSLHVQVFRI